MIPAENQVGKIQFPKLETCQNLITFLRQKINIFINYLSQLYRI